VTAGKLRKKDTAQKAVKKPAAANVGEDEKKRQKRKEDKKDIKEQKITSSSPPTKPAAPEPKQEFTISFHPERPGLEKFMGMLEAEVMKIVWTHGSMTVKRALYFINKEHNYAYTTIMTVMSRLSDKGLLAREKQAGSYLYTPVTDEKKFVKTAAEKILSGLMDDYRSVTTNLFHKIRKASKKS